MKPIFLDVYFAQHFAESAGNTSISAIFDVFTKSNLVYIIVIIFGLILVFFLIFYLFSKFKNPETYFERYKVIREEIAKVDSLYLKKELSFEEYTFALFNYAKEYEIIVSFLSKYPEYKSKLQSYVIKGVPQESNIRSPDRKKQDTVDYLFDLLKAQKKYYSKSEIRQALLDECFERNITELVLTKLDNYTGGYESDIKEDKSKIIDMINSLLSKQEKPEIRKESENIDLSDLSKKKKSVFDNEPITFEKYPTKIKEEKKETVLSSIKNLFKSKPKVHTVSEINDVFADIEKRLKENN